MGRARGTSAAVTMDRFDAVVGGRRGVGPISLGSADTPAARDANEWLFRAAEAGELERPLEELRKHRKNLDAPLVADLHADVAGRLAFETHEAWRPAAGALLSAISDSYLCDTVVEHEESGSLHLWAAGQAFGRLPDAGDPRNTVTAACGLKVNGKEFERAPRGSWWRARHQSSGKHACAGCQAAESGFTEAMDTGEKTLLAPQQELALKNAIDAAVWEQVAEHVTAPHQRSLKTLRSKAKLAYRGELVEHGYMRFSLGGAALAERVCSPRTVDAVPFTDEQVKAVALADFRDMAEDLDMYLLGSPSKPPERLPATHWTTMDRLGDQFRRRLESKLLAA